MNANTLVARALSALGKKTVYESPGDMPDFAASTWPEGARNDCSGFVDWCLRFSAHRRVDHPLYTRTNGGWFETTAIYKDGLESTGYFTKVDIAQPGSFVVYPDYVDENGRGHDGHIGIVVEASGRGVQGVERVVHCSLGAWRNLGDAVQVTAPSPWLSKASSIIVWFDGLEAM